MCGVQSTRSASLNIPFGNFGGSVKIAGTSRLVFAAPTVILICPRLIKHLTSFYNVALMVNRIYQIAEMSRKIMQTKLQMADDMLV